MSGEIDTNILKVDLGREIPQSTVTSQAYGAFFLLTF